MTEHLFTNAEWRDIPTFLDAWLADHEQELVATRRHIHAHPELSRQEFETSALVFKELVAVGLQPRMLFEGNGVLCDIGTGDTAIALRADLDALPIQDIKQVPYRSQVENVCHACGHDVHTTVVLGAGKALAKLAQAGELPGRVRLIFQPSEERQPSGAPDVIACGGLDDVDAIFGLHCAPMLPCGVVATRSGPMTAAADFFEIKLRGKGGHTARPHLTEDLVHAVGRLITQASSLLERKIDRRAGATLTFGSVVAGDHPDTIPSEAILRGTVRVLHRDSWQQLPALIPEIVKDLTAGSGAQVEVEYVRGVPPVINDRLAAETIARASAIALGSRGHFTEADISMGGEDFAFYVEQIPGAMLRLGVSPPGASDVHDIHQAGFDIDERAIGVGVRVMVHTALAALAEPAFR
jgi:amidohydrolase